MTTNTSGQTRTFFGVTLITFFVLLSACFVFQFKQFDDAENGFYGYSFVHAEEDALSKFRESLQKFQFTFQNLLLSEDLQNFKQASDEYQNLTQLYEKLDVSLVTAREQSLFLDIQESFETLQKSFAEVEEIYTASAGLQADVDQQETLFFKSLVEINTSASADGDYMVADLAGDVMQDYMSFRLMRAHFLMGQTGVSVEQLNHSFNGFKQIFAEFGTHLMSQKRIVLFKAVADNLDVYEQKVVDLIAKNDRYQYLVKNAVKADFEIIDKKLTSLLSLLYDDKQKLEAIFNYDIEWGKYSIYLGVVFSALLCLALYFVQRHTFARPLRDVAMRVSKAQSQNEAPNFENIKIPKDVTVLTDFCQNAQNINQDLQIKITDLEKAGEAHTLERRELLNEMAQDFDQKVAKAMQALAIVTQGIEGDSGEMFTAVQTSNLKAQEVATLSQQASVNAQTVTSAFDELVQSVAEISRQIKESNQIVALMTDKAASTKAIVHSLVEASNRINEFVGLITEIAGKTNMLALNATIEASRAGEMGKGFAVVAQEVKMLANQTAKATNEISDLTSNIEGETQTAVDAIEEITAIVERLNGISGAIEASTEMQDKATQEISHNIHQVSDATTKVSSAIANMSDLSSKSSEAASHVQDKVKSLKSNSEGLNSHVTDFVQQIKVA